MLVAPRLVEGRPKVQAGAGQELPRPKAKEIFLVMEGGGAKGYGHIAALKAIEKAGLKIRGTAGTSAGAVMAALIAAGWTADELANYHRDPKSKESASKLLDGLGVASAKRIFGRHNWQRVTRLRWGVGSPYQIARTVAMLAGFDLIIVLCLSLLWNWPWPASLLVGILLALGALAFLGYGLYAAIDGIASTHRIAQHIDAAIAMKLFPGEPSRKEPITFADLADQIGKPGSKAKSLRVIATNLEDSTVELFSETLTPDVPIADAVAASLAIPFLFDPVRITIGDRHGEDGATIERTFYDGGLVSNLPTFAFEIDRKLDPEVETLAVSIKPPPLPLSARQARPPVLKGFQLLMSAMWAALFGHTSLEQSEQADLIIIRPNLSILDFDIDQRDAAGLRAELKRIEEDVANDILLWHDDIQNRLFAVARERAERCLAAAIPSLPAAMAARPEAHRAKTGHCVHVFQFYVEAYGAGRSPIARVNYLRNLEISPHAPDLYIPWLNSVFYAMEDDMGAELMHAPPSEPPPPARDSVSLLTKGLEPGAGLILAPLRRSSDVVSFLAVSLPSAAEFDALAALSDEHLFALISAINRLYAIPLAVYEADDTAELVSPLRRHPQKLQAWIEATLKSADAAEKISMVKVGPELAALRAKPRAAGGAIAPPPLADLMARLAAEEQQFLGEANLTLGKPIEAVTGAVEAALSAN